MTLIQASLLQRKPYVGILMFASLYACVVLHLSLFPYANWRTIGIGPFEFLTGPWVPIHQTLLWTDIFANIAAYLPLGFMMVLGLNRRARTVDKLVAWLLCTLLSLSVEALQTYLPARVPSKMDVLTNSIGAALGILAAVVLTANRHFAPKLNNKLEGWLIQRAWLGMGLLTLWFLSILPPQNPPFSTGFWLGNLFDIPGPQQNGTPFGLPLDLILNIEKIAPHFINYCFLMCAWLIGLAQTHAGSPRLRLMVTLILITLGFRTLDTLFNQPADAWTYLGGLWLEANGPGLALAITVAVGISFSNLAAHQMARLSLLHLLGGWLITVLLPGVYDPDIPDKGAGLIALFRSIQEAGLWVSELWPILALTILVFLSKPERGFRR